MSSSTDSHHQTIRRLLPLLLWLFIGGGAYSLAVMLPESLMPLRLQQESIASDRVRMLILGTIGGVLNMTVCPWIGVVSDWHQSKWGRRIPFILKSMPPMVIALGIMAFIPQISTALRAAVAPWWQCQPWMMSALVAGLAMLLFQFFFMWVGSVIWYLLDDIVPQEHFGRVSAAFQLGMTAVSALYNRFVFPMAGQHMAAIFIGGAILYAAGITALCCFVKENPPPKMSGEACPASQAPPPQKASFLPFVRESFCHRFYILRYLLTAATAVGMCGYAFGYYFQSELLGGSLQQVGRLYSWYGILTAGGIAAVSLCGSHLVHRWHPVRIVLYLTLFAATGIPAAFRWLFGTLEANAYMTMMIAAGTTAAFINALRTINGMPFEMTTFPRSRFGAFCSMQALLRSGAVTLFGVLVGWLFDAVKDSGLLPAGFHYRLVPIWQVPWLAIAAFLAVMMYRQWQQLGGQYHYASPAPWLPQGKETLEESGDQTQQQQQPPSPLMQQLCRYILDGSYGIFLLSSAVLTYNLHGSTPLYMSVIILSGMVILAVLWLIIRRKTHHALTPQSLQLLSCITASIAATELVRLWSAAYCNGKFMAISILLPIAAMIIATLATAIIAKLERETTL